MEKDVFISFSSKDTSIANKVKEILEKNGIEVWISYEAINGGNDYSIEIPLALKSCEYFLLILSSNSCESVNVAKELSLANTIINRHTGRMRRVLPLMVEECNYEKLEYYLTNIQVISTISSFDETMKKILVILKGDGAHNHSSNSFSPSFASGERIANKYFKGGNEFEIKRLELQGKLFKIYDQFIYDEICSTKKNQMVLDVGSNDGTTILDRIGCHESIERIIALESDEETVVTQNEKYKNNFITFYQVDVEADEFKRKLTEICENEGIEQFDFIHISMLLLHLKSPMKLLRILKSFLKSGGVLFIKDIDDGFTVAYPDEHGLFAKAIDIYNDCEEGGFRHSGRQIFSYLKKLHMSNIQLKLNGINTTQMDYDKRNALYELYFSGCIKEDIRKMVEKFKGNTLYESWYNWFLDNEENMQEEFFEDSFFFNLGVLIYICNN